MLRVPAHIYFQDVGATLGQDSDSVRLLRVREDDRRLVDHPIPPAW
jgi:hypothetical protein